jgi:hypothetical protein
MAVLIEALSVIIKNEAIERSYGSVEAFIEKAPNGTVCADQFITRVGFMDPADVGIFVKTLEMKGIVHLDHGKSVDILVVDQIKGPTSEFDWCEISTAELLSGEKLTICSHKDEDDCGLITPKGWKYEGSLSSKCLRVDVDQIDDKFEYLESDGFTQTWIEKGTGKKYYMGRTSNIL